MGGIVREDDPERGESGADDLLIKDSIAREGEGAGARRRTRRTLEEVLEERRLRRQLRDVFSEEQWDD